MSDVRKKGGDDEAGPINSELHSIAELLEGDFGEALGDLLGAPPPLPPPPDDQVMTSAPRPGSGGRSRPPVTPARAPAGSEPPTDDEVFGSAAFDAAFARSVGEPTPPPVSPRDEHHEHTRIAPLDEALLKKARPEADEPPARRTPPPPPPRRGPAVVRRDRLPSREVAAAPDAEREEATRIADPGFTMAQLERDIEIEAEAPAPEASVPLDESFYDGIEIGAAAEAEPEPAPARSAASSTPRRVTQNVVRRVSGSTGSVPAITAAAAPPPAAAAPRARTAAEEAKDESNEFLARTGVFDPPEEAAALADAIDAVAAAVPAMDDPGSNPLIDIIADFQRIEDTSAGAAPPSADLSADLEGFDVDEEPREAWIEAEPPPEAEVYAEAEPPPDQPEEPEQPAGEAAATPIDAYSGSVEELEVSGEEEQDFTTISPAPRFPEAAAETLDLPIDAARFQLAAVAPPDGDNIEAERIAELAQLEAELETAAEITAEPLRAARLRLRAGAAAERLGDLERAREHYEEACQSDPDLQPAVRAMRRLLLRHGDFAEALRYLDRELELASVDERRALAAYRADLLLAVGEQDLARVAYGELSDARPDDLRALLAQVELAYSDDRDEELLDASAAAASHVRDPELAGALHLLRARVHERAGRETEAEGALQAALEARPGDRLALWGLARLALRAGRPAAAGAYQARFLDGVTDGGAAAAVARRRARAALAEDDAAAAQKVLAELADTRDPLLLELAAEACEGAGDATGAARALAAWAEVEPAPARRAEVLHRLAAMHAGPLDDPEGALRALRRAAAADPEDLDAAGELAVGDTEATVALERAAAAADPAGAAGAHLRAAQCWAGAGRLEDVVAELRAARDAAPRSPIIVDALAAALRAAGRLEELHALYGEAGDVASCGPAAARERAARAAEALAASDSGEDTPARVAAAEAAWRALLAAEPGAWVAHAALERLAAQRDDRAALATVLGDQLGATRDSVRLSATAARRAVLLGELGDEEGARATLDSARAVDPGDARAADRLALAAGAADQWGAAAAAWGERAQALLDGPEKDALRYRAATALEWQGDLARAATLLAPTLASRPEFGGAAVALERLYRKLGEPAELAAILEADARGLEGPGRAARLVRLAEIVADGGGEPARSATLYREALALRGADAVARDGFRRVSIAAHEIAPLADLALADLNAAETRGDVAGKVAAYEELARVDGDLRGDVASATLAWESAVALDPSHLPALRALERTYLGGQVDGGAVEARAADLGVIYDKLGAALAAAAPDDAAAVILERARLHERLGHGQLVLADHREALALAAPRMSLFRLEMRAREAGQLDEMAALAESVAGFLAGDARGQAAFLTRAGEALADLGRVEDAIARFRAAADTSPGFVPALRAWRRVALAGESWGEVIEACEREALAVRADDERLALLHLAGVAAMDRAGEPDRAARALRQVLALEPRHDDAFRRLRRLFAAPDRHAELAELLSARVDIEAHPGKLIDLHHTLALLYRDSLHDRERAKAHLRAVLARDPRNLPAVTALSDLAWDQGLWAEAAEALIVRAKLEERPDVQKEIFFRLGVIYADKLPDRRWAVKSFERVLQLEPNDPRALEHLSTLSVDGGEWRVALAATERLVGLDGDSAAKVTHLLRISRIHEEGGGDRKRAEEALRRATEVDPGSTAALGAVIGFYSRVRDTASLRVNLDRIAGQMRSRLERDAFDAVPYRVLARALRARSEAGVVGSLEAARCAAELALLFGDNAPGDDVERALAAEAVAVTPSAKGLGLLQVDEMLFHPSIPNGFRQVFRLLYDTLSKRFPPDLRRAGVTKADRLPRSGHPVRDVVMRVALELGVGDFEVYVSNARPNSLAVELTDPLSIVLGANLAAFGPQRLRFAAARCMKLAMSYMGVPASLGPEELGVLIAAVIRQADSGFAPLGVNLSAVGEEAQRLARLIPKRLRDEIIVFANEISGLGFDRHALWLGVQHTGNRAGLIASGSVQAGLDVLCRTGNHGDARAARGDAQVEELLRFAVGSEHSEVRAALAV